MSRKSLFACSSCKSTFNNKTALDTHLASHNEFQIFQIASASISGHHNSWAHVPSTPSLTNHAQVLTPSFPPPAQPPRALPPAYESAPLPLTEEIGRPERTRVVLDGNRSYLKSSLLLERLGVRMHVILRCLLCIQCGRAFTPKSMAGHLQKHGIPISEDDKNGLLEFARANSVGDDPRDSPLPTNYGPPVELVPEQDGFACGVDECPYASGVQPSIVSHRKNHHPLEPRNTLIPVSVQHLFPSFGRGYFIVSPSLRKSSPGSLFTRLISDVLPKMAQLQYNIPVKSRNVLPLHRVTRWWEILGPHALNRSARKAIISLAGPIQKEELGLSTLPGLCQQYLVEAQTASKSAGFTVRKQLVPEDPVAYWHELTTQGSLAEYARDLSRTVAASIRAATNPTIPFKLPMTPLALAHALELLRKLNSGEATWKCLHPLFKTMWELPNSTIGEGKGEGDQEGYLIRFLAAAALKEDGTLMNAKRLVSWITHLKYASRAFCMVEGGENVDSHGAILDSVTSATHQYLEQGTMKPYSQLCELSAFASNQVFMEPTVPRICWNQDMTAISIDGELVVLDALREGLKTQIEAVKNLILQVTGEDDIRDWLSCTPPVKDDPRNSEPGYSFLEDSSLKDAHLPVLQRLVEHPDWRIGSVDNEHRWLWHISSIARFFRETGEIQKAIMPLIRVVSNNRGTELSDTKLANTPFRLRNLTVYQGRLYNNGAYSKTTENTEHDSYNPSLLPLEVSLLLVHYLVVIRPIEKILSQVMWEDEVAALYKTHLFLAQGRLLTSEDDSEFLALFFQEHCNAVVQLNRWRHTSASLMREFIDDRFLATSRRSAVGMGHSVSVARKHYAQDHNTPAFATSDVLFEQSWVDSEFHALLGFGSKPPPVALRLCTSDEDTIQAAVRGAIKDLRQGIVQDVLEGLGNIFKREVSILASKISAASDLQQMRLPSSSFMIPDSEHHPSSSSSSSSFVPDSEPHPISKLRKGTPTHEDPSDMDTDCPWNLSSSPSLAHQSSPTDHTTSVKDKDDVLILAAFQKLFGPEARPKSDEQHQLCKEVLLKDRNIIAVLPTGSGKSAAWLVPAMIDLQTIIVVVVPFKKLLEQHLAFALDHKLKAEHWRAAMGSDVDPTTNLVFVACESIKYGFSKFLESQLGKRIHTIIFDEAHEYLGLHKARDHRPMLELLGKFPIQKVLTTGTLPLRMETLLLRNTCLNHVPPTHIMIRAPTLRPELAHHVVQIPSTTPSTVSGLDITMDLAKSLLGLLHSGERIITFVMSVSEADALSARLGCSKYYSGLGEDAEVDVNEKAINHTRWVNGQSVIMVATPALIQGIDYPNVRFVIFHGSAYGLISYYQGAGRGGRSGSRCDVFTLRDERCKRKSREHMEDVEASAEWDEFATTTRCRLSVITSCFDGQALNCSTIPGQEPCNNCHPGDKFHDIALAVVAARQANGISGAGRETSQGGTNNRAAKRAASPTSSEELLWNNLTPFEPEDYLNAQQAEQEYGRKKPRLDQTLTSNLLASSSPFHSSVFRASPLSERATGPSFSPEPRAEQDYGRRKPGLGQAQASTSSFRSSPLYSFSLHSSSFHPSPSTLNKRTVSLPSSNKQLEYERKASNSSPFHPSPLHSFPLPLTQNSSASATPTGTSSTSGTPRSQRGGVGKAILQGAAENGQSEKEKRQKSARLSNIMPTMQGICPLCFILTGRRVKSLPIGEQKGSGHRPFDDCGLPVTFTDYTAFRQGIMLRAPYFYCFTCGMPQSKNGNRLEPKVHSDWSKEQGKAASGTGRGPCPWSNIVQACVFAMYFHPTTMTDLLSQFNYTDKEDPEDMTLDEWRTWLSTDLFDQGEYWKGLEVFLFMMAQRGLIGA